MTGDLSDFISRLRTVLPQRWFAEKSPNLMALLSSISVPWVWLYNLIRYTVSQTRLATAFDQWLDLIAIDYFGCKLLRQVNEGDVSYRTRIQGALLQETATRVAVATGLERLTGSAPSIFEPANCLDTGSYGGFTETFQSGGTGLAYGRAGGWGSLSLPLQFFVTATCPAMAGIGGLAGYGTSVAGYCEGAISYVNLSLLPGYVTDADIQATLCSLLPVNAVAWLRIF